MSPGKESYVDDGGLFLVWCGCDGQGKRQRGSLVIHEDGPFATNCHGGRTVPSLSIGAFDDSDL